MYERYEKLLKKYGWTNYKVAQMTSGAIQESSLSDWKIGKIKTLGFHKMVMLAELFNVPIDYFTDSLIPLPRNVALRNVRYAIYGAEGAPDIAKHLNIPLDQYSMYEDGSANISDEMIGTVREMAVQNELPLKRLGFPDEEKDTLSEKQIQVIEMVYSLTDEQADLVLLLLKQFQGK